MRIFLTLLAIASLSLANLSNCAQADQLLYDGKTGQPTITLKDNGGMWIDGGIAYLKGSIIYDRRKIEPIGYRKGNVLYSNDGHVLAWFERSIRATTCTDQLLYDAETGKRTILLKNDGSLWGWHSSDNSDKIFAYLKGLIIYDRRHSEIIGYRKGNVLYRDDSPYTHVIGYFKR